MVSMNISKLILISSILILFIVGISVFYMSQTNINPIQQEGRAGYTITIVYDGQSISLDLPSTPIVIIGGGSTFVNPQMQAWATKFRDLSKGLVTVNYQSIGSGAGVAKWKSQALDFGASDIPLPKDIYSEIKGTGRQFIQIPIVAGAIAVIYNLPEWDEAKCGNLRLSGEVLADIYLGNIIKWNDPKIVSLQDKCGDLLPDSPIIGIHRSDGSGTTAAFTLYLALVSDEWKNSVGWGYTVEWPRDQLGYGLGGKGNEGVTQKVVSTPYSIGYVELAYALKSKLPVAELLNKAGNFVLPNATTISEAVKYASKKFPDPADDWSIIADKLLYLEGELSYPIVTYVYLVLDLDYNDDNKNKAIKAFLTWILTEGQKSENIVEGYIALPKEALDIALKAVEKIGSS